jgi:hypothetical protein
MASANVLCCFAVRNAHFYKVVARYQQIQFGLFSNQKIRILAAVEYTKKLFMRKNISFLLALAFVVNCALAQTQRTRFAFIAGPVASTMYQKVSGKTSTGDYRFGETAGFLLDVPMQKNGSFQPGLNVVTKGMRNDITQGNVNGTLKTNITYLEVTLNVVFRIKNAKDNIILGGGAVPSLPISGRRLTDLGTTEGRQDLTFGDKTSNDFNGTDFGADALAGYEFSNGFFATANYYYGFNRQFVGGDPKDKLYNRYFAIRLGYFIPFSKNKK